MGRAILRQLLAAGLAAAVLLAASPAGANLWRLTVKEAATAAGRRCCCRKSPCRAGISRPMGGPRGHALVVLPETVGRQAVIASAKVLEGLRYYLRDAPVEFALPNQLTLARGGKVLDAAALRAMAVETLTPQVAALGGEAAGSVTTPTISLWTTKPASAWPLPRSRPARPFFGMW